MVLNLYLETIPIDRDDQVIDVTLESFICLLLLDYIEQPEQIVVNLVASSQRDHDKSTILRINAGTFRHNWLSSDEYQDQIASHCHFPVLVSDNNVIIAGLCGVCRNLIKNSDEKFIELLGFKAACLVAPTEASIWTKFCEIDMVRCTKELLRLLRNINIDTNEKREIRMPDDLARFEGHMSQPIRMHNVYKLARDREKEQKRMEKVTEQINELMVDELGKKQPRRLPKTKKIASGTPIERLNIEHKFVEGTQFSIADLILYPNFWIIRTLLSRRTANADTELPTLLPLTHKWLSAIEVENDARLRDCMTKFNLIEMNFQNSLEKPEVAFHLNSIANCSLYKSVPQRYKPAEKIFTKQKHIESVLEKIVGLNVTITSEASEATQAMNELDFGWDEMPFEVLPDAAELPLKRLARKKHQLASLAKQICQIARDGDRIVDFCSGTGHLGIVLAYKLPKCHIVLLENKEESLMRAKQRVDRLKLTNVEFFQCNLDYYCGRFDVGTSLHACGVATDIVLMHCINRRAKFVCCPCCYGGCHPMPHITYPRSQLFRNGGVDNQEYMHLAHGADQSHADDGRNNAEKCVQGQYCMDVVDTDRKLYAEELGYRVQLCRLYPEDCTPKNRLLVGVI